MSKIEQLLRRKIKNRNIAIENLGIDSTFVLSDSGKTFEVEAKKTIEENLINANAFAKLDAHRSLHSDRGLLGKIIIFFKKVIRKTLKVFMGWYIFPILSHQSRFNETIVNTLSLVRKMVYDADESSEEFKVTIDKLRYENEIIRNKMTDMKGEMEYIKSQLNITCDYKKLLDKKEIDYFKFENKFRGSREQVYEIQKEFLQYFIGREGVVLDIGCGRGEFLELLLSNEVKAKGIDIYQPFIEFCQELGLDVELADSVTYLDFVCDNSLGGIFMSHVIEHLNVDYTLKLIELAYQKLEEGACFILETPNPESLFTFIDFYIDIEHKKPVHYKTLEFLFYQAGFSNVQRINPSLTKFGNAVSHLQGSNIENLDEFNCGMDNLNQYLTAYQDYVLIGIK